MQIEKLDGAVRWCIKPSIEEGRYGDYKPRLPWRGRVQVKFNPGFEEGVLWIHACNEEGTEVDEDSNASAVVQPFDLFQDEREAQVAFVGAMLAWLGARAEELTTEIKELGRLGW